MERAFAETLNLRLRSERIVMGEVYVIPINELDDREMTLNRVRFSDRKVKIEKFIRAFEAFSGRYNIEIDHQYKYDASALVPVDLSTSPPKIVFNGEDLSEYGFSSDLCDRFSAVCGEFFDDRLVENYLRIHG